MAQYNTLYIKLSNSQLNKLNSAIKNKTEVVLRLSLAILVILMIKSIFPMNYY